MHSLDIIKFSIDIYCKLKKNKIIYKNNIKYIPHNNFPLLMKTNFNNNVLQKLKI